MSDDSKSVNWQIFALSCVTRLLFWGSMIYILYLCFEKGYSLITMHVVTCTIGCTLLMVEAILMISGDALLATKISDSCRIRLHWMMHFVGLEMLVIGIGITVYYNYQNDASHFTSNHGKVGLTSAILALVVGVCAIPTLFKKIIPQVINFGTFKRTHIYLGVISMILVWASQITGFWTGWWSHSDLARNFTLSAYVIGGLCLFAKPCYSTLRSSFH